MLNPRGSSFGSFDADLNQCPFSWIDTKIQLSLVHNVKPWGLGLGSCDAGLNQHCFGWIGTKNRIMELIFCYN
jgi:hypothetical protein